MNCWGWLKITLKFLAIRSSNFEKISKEKNVSEELNGIYPEKKDNNNVSYKPKLEQKK